eukprot:364274-Chlamydomonas_euryale.AAC.6
MSALQPLTRCARHSRHTIIGSHLVLHPRSESKVLAGMNAQRGQPGYVAGAWPCGARIRSIRRSYVATPYFRSFGGRSFGDLELEWPDFDKKGTVGKLFSRSHYNSCILKC